MANIVERTYFSVHIIANAPVEKMKSEKVFGQDDREEGKCMYKDVWKKFGVKVLIVLCSVLLLGGVAVVAPKISANESDGTTEETGMPPENGQDGTAVLPDSVSDGETVANDGEEPGDGQEGLAGQTVAEDGTGEPADASDGEGDKTADDESGRQTDNTPSADDDGHKTVEPAAETGKLKDEASEQGQPGDDVQAAGSQPDATAREATPRYTAADFMLSEREDLDGETYVESDDVIKSGLNFSGKEPSLTIYQIEEVDGVKRCSKLGNDNSVYERREVTGDVYNVGTVSYIYTGGLLNGITLSYEIVPLRVNRITCLSPTFVINGTGTEYAFQAADDKQVINSISLVGGGSFTDKDVLTKGRDGKTYTINYPSSERGNTTYKGTIEWKCFVKSDGTALKSDFNYSVKKAFNETTVSITPDADFTYNGDDMSAPDFEIIEKGTTNTAGTADYDSVKKGTAPLEYTITINAETAAGFVEGSISFTYTIRPKPIASSDKKLLTSDFELTTSLKEFLNKTTPLDFDQTGLNGSCHISDLGLKLKTANKQLVKDTDFTVSFSKENGGCGKVDITITGKGCYTGTATDFYYHVEKDISKHADVYVNENTLLSGIHRLEYDPSLDPDNPDILTLMNFKVKDRETQKELKMGTDYSIQYLDANGNIVAKPEIAINESELTAYKIRITGTGSYKNQFDVQYRVEPYNVQTHQWRIDKINPVTFVGSPSTANGIVDAMKIYRPVGESYEEVAKDKIKDSYIVKWIKDGETKATIDEEGTWVMELTFSGNYTGVITSQPIEVSSRDISTICTYKGFKDAYKSFLTYNGKPKKLFDIEEHRNMLDIVLTTGGKPFDQKNFIIDEAEGRQGTNTNVTDQENNFFYIKGNPKEGYTGEIKCELPIEPLDLNDAGIQWPTDGTDILVDFAGEDVKPEFSIQYDGESFSLQASDYAYMDNPSAVSGGVNFGKKGYPTFDKAEDATSVQYKCKIAGRNNFKETKDLTLRYKKKDVRANNDEQDGIKLNNIPSKITFTDLNLSLEEFNKPETLKQAVADHVNENISITFSSNETSTTTLINKANNADVTVAQGKHDYEITKDDVSINKDGTVTVTIRFAYRFGKQKQFKISVGEDIGDTIIRYGDTRYEVQAGDPDRFIDISDAVNLTYTQKPGEMRVKVGPQGDGKPSVTLSYVEDAITGREKQLTGVEYNTTDASALDSADFTYRYVNADPHTNAAPGPTYIELQGTGRGYFGTIRVNYKIKPKVMSHKEGGYKVEIKDLEKIQEYRGEPITISPSAITVIDLESNTEVFPEDYKVSYEQNKNVGWAVVKITGQRNYTTPDEMDAIRGTFQIVCKDIAKAFAENRLIIVINDGQPLYYNGGVQRPPVEIREYDASIPGYVALQENVDYELQYENNGNGECGDHTLTIKGIRNYQGKYTHTYTILPVNLDSPDVRVTVDGIENKVFAYDGLWHWPGGMPELAADDPDKADKENYSTVCNLKVEFKVGEEYRLVEPSQYTIECRNNRDIGTADLLIKPKDDGNFYGTKEAKFEIKGSFDKKKQIESENENGIIAYLKIGGGVLEEDGRYKVPYEGGAEVKPGFEFYYHLKGRKDSQEKVELLHDGVDYTLTYRSNIEIGTASVVIKGMGRFTDEQEIAFDITADLEGSELECIWNNPDKPYGIYKNGDYVIPDITVKYRDKVLTQGEEFKFENVDNNRITPKHGDKADIKIVANTPFVTGKKIFSFWIFADMEDMNVSLPESSYTYTGEKIEPETTVSLTTTGSAITLKRGTDYKAEYSDNINAGKGQVILTGVEEYGYCGTRAVQFNIEKRILDNVTAEIDILHAKDIVYTGKKIVPSKDNIIVKCHYETEAGQRRTIRLKEDEFNVDSQNSINAKEGKDDDIYAGPYLVIQGVGNFQGVVNKAFTINRKKISDDDVVLKGLKESYGYWNGEPVQPEFTLEYNEMVLNGKAVPNQLVSDAYYQNCDYRYLYESNTEPTPEGCKITIEGWGNFTGTRVETFMIVKKDISEEDITEILTPENFSYTGEECVPTVKLNFRRVNVIERMLNPKITYQNNISVSDKETPNEKRAQIVIEADKDDPHYEGTRIVYFDINRRSLAKSTQCLYLADDKGEQEVDISKYHFDFVNAETTVHPDKGRMKLYCVWNQNGVTKRKILTEGTDFTIAYFSEEGNGETVPQSYAGRVKAVVTGINNFCDTDEFFYYIGDDISSATCTIAPSSAVFNAMAQPPKESVSGVSLDKCNVVWYKGSVAKANIIKKSQMIDAATYYVQIEGVPSKGTFAKEPRSMTYKITPRSLTENVLADGFKREYQYTGAQICPVGITVTDYIDGVKYKLTENVDYTLSYSNNINIGTATITVNGINNFKGTGTGKFLITASTIAGGNTLPGNSYLEGTGQISGAKPVAASDVKLTMDTANAMYYTGNPLYPRVSISGMTENVDYTVTYSSNKEVGIGVINIAGIGNNSGTITRYFRIIASLSKCTIGAIPTQEYTGSAITPSVVVRCGNTILKAGTDYTVTYINNINIGTATVMIRAASNENYTGSATTTFKIGNDMSSFLVTGYAPTLVYTGDALTPGVIVESGNTVLTQGKDYTVSYRNNVDVGLAEIIVTGIGRYDGTQTVNFVIEARNIEACIVSDVEDKVYTGDAYMPPVTVSDSGTVLTNGVDYTVTYKDNTNPGIATIVIEPVNRNYAGTKTINFKIAGLAVEGVKVSSIKPSSMNLSWARQDYASGYQICNAQSREVATVTSNKNSAKISGLAGGTKYQYKVRSYVQNTDGTRSYGAFSPLVSATTKLKTPSVRLYAKKAGQARVEWNAVSGAGGYEVFYKASKNADFRKVKNINKSNVRVCKIKGLKKGQKCFVKVRAFKYQGSKKIYSAKSKGKNVKIK